MSRVDAGLVGVDLVWHGNFRVEFHQPLCFLELNPLLFPLYVLLKRFRECSSFLAIAKQSLGGLDLKLSATSRLHDRLMKKPPRVDCPYALFIVVKG